ncbi:hypothetical protein ACMT4L_16825 [Deinococcus sp. A31D244]|uniref:hypothetical protein n=1 Tax=Deinococcus sp. A31D244 TaxID=3397675 RepID=UPI0039E0F085
MSRTDDRRCYAGRCPNGCILMVSLLPDDTEDGRRSAAETLADAVLSGLTVSLEDFDAIKNDDTFFKCRNGRELRNCSVSVLPDEANVTVTWDGMDTEGEYGYADENAAEPIPVPIPDEAARVIRSVAAGDGVWDQSDLRRVVAELEHDGRIL